MKKLRVGQGEFDLVSIDHESLQDSIDNAMTLGVLMGYEVSELEMEKLYRVRFEKSFEIYDLLIHHKEREFIDLFVCVPNSKSLLITQESGALKWLCDIMK